jgi:Fe2+ or Zn2+ uptake regulation protein
MNEIEAIAYFEKLIKYFEDKEGEPYWSEVHNSMSRQMITVALEAMREQAERSKGCVWCKEGNKVFHDGQHFHMFCSYCGKRLEVESIDAGTIGGEMVQRALKKLEVKP